MTKRVTTGINRLFDMTRAAARVKALPPKEMAKIEKKLAIDHLYYSSALEGSKVTRAQIAKMTA